MVTTMAASHGVERQCAACGLSYRYPQARTFKCESCGAEQFWDREAMITADPRKHLRDEPLPAAKLTPTGDPELAPEIPLLAVSAALNHMASDQARQLHNRLAILHLVDEVNRWRSQSPEHFDLVRRLLGGAGVKLD